MNASIEFDDKARAKIKVGKKTITLYGEEADLIFSERAVTVFRAWCEKNQPIQRGEKPSERAMRISEKEFSEGENR